MTSAPSAGNVLGNTFPEPTNSDDVIFANTFVIEALLREPSSNTYKKSSAVSILLPKSDKSVIVEEAACCITEEEDILASANVPALILDAFRFGILPATISPLIVAEDLFSTLPNPTSPFTSPNAPLATVTATQFEAVGSANFRHEF